MIIVNPDAYSFFDGSFYSTSVTAGDWETFIADELVQYIDSALPHAGEAREPRAWRAFNGRLWDDRASR